MISLLLTVLLAFSVVLHGVLLRLLPSACCDGNITSPRAAALRGDSGRVFTKASAFARSGVSRPQAGAGRPQAVLTGRYTVGGGTAGLGLLLLVANNQRFAAENVGALDGDDAAAAGSAPGVPSAGPGGDGSDEDNAAAEAADFVMDKLVPTGMTIGFGAVTGFCSGYAAKQVGKLAAIGIGVVFMSVQVLQYSGYIPGGVDWHKVAADVTRKVDTDGDGKITTNDLKYYFKKFVRIMTANVPGAGGFAVGALYGLRS